MKNDRLKSGMFLKDFVFRKVKFYLIPFLYLTKAFLMGKVNTRPLKFRSGVMEMAFLVFCDLPMKTKKDK